MKSWNHEARELKLRHEEQRAAINLEYNRRQVALSHDLDLAKNELNYCSAMLRRQDADVEALAERMAATSARIQELSQGKVDAEYERKQALTAITRDHYAELERLEARYAAADAEGGKEVAV